MVKSSTRIYFPPKLSGNSEDPLDDALSDHDYARLQVDLVKAVYARATNRGTEHPLPEAAAFLEVFVNLIDTMEVNNPDQAYVCMSELRNILNAIYPATINGEPDEGSVFHRFGAVIVRH